MAIIANNCISGYIYKEILKQPYDNPFIWCRIYADDFLYLIKNLNSIDFNKIELRKQKNKVIEKARNYYLLIDNKIKVYYTHYQYDSVASEITIRGMDVYYNKIEDYIINTYKKRLSRTAGIFKNPVVILQNQYNAYDSILTDLINYCQAKKYKLLLFTNNYNKPYNKAFVKILPHDLDSDHPHKYSTHYKNEILEFLRS